MIRRNENERFNFFVQSTADAGYFLFPHQPCVPDSLRLPPLCQCNGHPTEKYVKWDALSKHPETFRSGDRVILYQAGNPKWLRGFWGYGVIKRTKERVYIRSEALLEAPLIVDNPTRQRLRGKFLKAIVRTNDPAPYRGTYATMADADFDALKKAIDRQHKVHPVKVQRRAVPLARTKRATDAFKAWAEWKGWKILSAGYPDLLAEFPNGKIAAFEAKQSDDLRPAQEAMFKVLRTAGLRIAVLRDTPNAVASLQIAQHHWKVIAEDMGPITKGWPDFVLQKGNKIVAVELKTGWKELVSEMQVATLSALSSQLGIEVHIVRAVEGSGGWELFDDTERWLLYPPTRAQY